MHTHVPATCPVCFRSSITGPAHCPGGHHPPRSHPRERNNLHRRFRWYVLPSLSLFPFSISHKPTHRTGSISNQRSGKHTSYVSYTPSITQIPSTAYLRFGFLISANWVSMSVLLLPHPAPLIVPQVPVILVGNKIDLRGGEVTNEALEEEIIPIMADFKASSCPSSLAYRRPLPRKSRLA